ncbi:MAG: hypothetical protein KBT11_10710, partial [Treponema sp.]|nr:hypothetical protein [Candidatus Treponema equifaecale]
MPLASKRRNLLLTFALLLIIGFEAAAQAKFTQKLEWRAEPNAFEYKVEVVSVDGKIKPEFFTTDNNSVSFSKPAGLYRYRVYVYDFLGRESSVSEWRNFEITKAYQPEIFQKGDFAEIYVTYDENEKIKSIENRIVLPVELKGVSKKSEIELTNVGNGEKIKTILQDDGNGKYSLVVEKAVSGKYRLRVKNPGGLVAETSRLISIVQKDNLSEIAAIKAEKIRIQEEKRAAIEAERMAKEDAKRAEEERIAAEKLEKERLAQEEAERKKAEKIALEEAKRAEEERIAAEKAEEEERKRIVREERKNRPAREIIFFAGADMSANIYNGEF